MRIKYLFRSFKIIVLVGVLFCNQQATGQAPTTLELKRWETHVKQTKIIRDEWGIPHVYGKTDADAVFGLMYAQCEENFHQIEVNFLEMLGRTEEQPLQGIFDKARRDIYQDLMMRLIQDSVDAIKDYERSPAWFQQLLVAHADGINYYLYKHPQVHPAVLQKFKPWYHLMWTDGSVSPTRYGGIKRKDVLDFYKENKQDAVAWADIDDYAMEEKTLKGSNGFAIAPKHSKTGDAMLYINPHVPFYFRSEMHMVSEQGLNVYGAVTWGQFFIYQGFNEHCGWMHTSSYADVADVYAEKVMQKEGKWYYQYENEWKPVQTRIIPVKYYGDGNGDHINTKNFITYRTHHGPVMGSRDGQWLSLRENNRSLNALMECWIRTKSKNMTAYKKALNLLSNNSNNTVYADAEGNIAYWHGNFMPKRSTQFDFTRPVDGSTKATEWQGIHPLNEIVQSINPINGWFQNCNSTPFSVAGAFSPDPKNYPSYMAPDGENARALNAVRLLNKIEKISLDELIELGYNKHLTAFDILLPPLIAYAKKIILTPQQQKAIQYLANWDHNADTNSIAQTIAVEWATKLALEIPAAATEEEATQGNNRLQLMIAEVSNEKKLSLLDQSLSLIATTYGENKTWEIPWGQINKYQRGLADREFPLSDARPSISVAQTSSKWGQMPAFESRTFSTHKRYGFSGNSFIAAVRFGKKLEAKTIITGGQSFDPNSTHFTDQAKMYVDGHFKTIHFYKSDVLAHKVIAYNPGLER
jgi:acyl-homoserine lactone acylase PvdQ